MWRCSSCGEENDLDTLRCPCGHERDDRPSLSVPTEGLEEQPDQPTVTFSWIEDKAMLLSARLGPFKANSGERFFFDPTPGFYGFIAQGSIGALNDGIKILADHLQIRTCPVIEPWNDQDAPLVTSEYDWTTDKNPAGVIKYRGAGHSRIAVNIVNKHSHFVMGSILAHELTHYFLFQKGICLADDAENERFTDLATVFLGLGKLTLNGYDPLRWEVRKGDSVRKYRYQVGYLNTLDVARGMVAVQKHRHLPASSISDNLLKSSLLRVDAARQEYERYTRLKALEGEYRCLACSQTVSYSVNGDDHLVCSCCGKEWNAAISVYEARRRFNPLNWFKNDTSSPAQRQKV